MIETQGCFLSGRLLQRRDCFCDLQVPFRNYDEKRALISILRQCAKDFSCNKLVSLREKQFRVSIKLLARDNALFFTAAYRVIDVICDVRPEECL